MTNNVFEEVGMEYPDLLDCSTNASICNIEEILPRIANFPLRADNARPSIPTNECAPG
ncbi:hypothetical protein RYX36_006262 [Vicia faba]